MEQLGLNSEINVGEKTLLVQTAFRDDKAAIVADVLQNGDVVDSTAVEWEAKSGNGKLQSRIKEVHEQIVSDIELLFYIADKVRTVQHPASCNKMGIVFQKRGFLTEAIECFDLAISLDANLADAYLNAGICYRQNEAPEQAEKIFLSGIEVANDHADLHLNLGRLRVEQRAFGEALKSFERALELNREYFAAHYFIAVAFLKALVSESTLPELPDKSTMAERAMQHFDRAGDHFEPFTNDDFSKGRASLGEEKFEAALECYTQAYARVQPQMDLTFDHEFYLKFMYGGRGKDDAFVSEYIDRLRAAIRDFPDYADLHNNLGIAYLILCRNLFLKALESFRRALKINPGYKRAQKNLKLAENDGKGFLILLRALLK